VGRWSLAWRHSGGGGEGGGEHCGIGGHIVVNFCGDGGSAIAAATSSPPQALSVDNADDSADAPIALYPLRRACTGALWTEVADGGGTVLVALGARAINETSNFVLYPPTVGYECCW
tara:strand:+ start:1498 stop:1848 length:351 start_codon:yes stop_codon:yes gene_type:complete